jgi:hypothetical protein
MFLLRILSPSPSSVNPWIDMMIQPYHALHTASLPSMIFPSFVTQQLFSYAVQN